MITRTPETEEHYRQIARRLMQTCGRDLGRHPSELTVAMMAGWMIQRRTEWASATWRQYRAALDFVTGSQLSGILSRSELPPPAPRGERTSGLKEKRLPPDDLQKLLDYLLDGELIARRMAKGEVARFSFGIGHSFEPVGLPALQVLTNSGISRFLGKVCN